MKKRLAMLLAGSLLFGAAACGKDAEETPKTAEVSKEEYIQGLIEDMDAAEKAGQLMMADFRTNADGTDMTILSDEAADALAAYHISGVILFAENLDTAEQTKTLTAALQKAADIVLMPANLAEAAQALTEAIETGEIPAARVEDALWHILSLKYEKGLL